LRGFLFFTATQKCSSFTFFWGNYWGSFFSLPLFSLKIYWGISQSLDTIGGGAFNMRRLLFMSVCLSASIFTEEIKVKMISIKLIFSSLIIFLFNQSLGLKQE